MKSAETEKKTLPLSRVGLLVFVGLLVGALGGSLATWFISRSGPQQVYEDEMTACTQVGAENSVSVTVPLSDLTEIETIKLEVITGGYEGDEWPITVSREVTVDEFDEEVGIATAYLDMSKTMVEVVSEVSVELIGKDGSTDAKNAGTYRLEKPQPTQFSPNGPDCEPHVAQISLDLKDGRLVPIED